MQATTAEQLVFFGFILLAVGLRVGEMWRKQGSERGTVSMNWSFGALVGAAGLVYVGSLLEFVLVGRPYRLGLGLVGMGLYAGSVWLRLAAIGALGRYWSLHIEIRQQHPLIRQGPYQFVRHPAYAAFILETSGVALAGNAWLALALAWLVYVPLLVWRIRREETALRAKLGPAYDQYRREVGMLVPRAWPLRSVDDVRAR